MEEVFFKNQTKVVSEYFENWMNTVDESNGLDKFSQLYRLFSDFEQNKNNDVKIYHNCIGCNIHEGATSIKLFLKNHEGYPSVRHYLMLYSLTFYILAERIVTINDEMSGKKNDWSDFPNLRRIKRWANFFKHPKSYMFLHHATYHLSTDPDQPNFLIDGIIDDNFVQEYYGGNSENEKLHSLIANKRRHKVFFPDLIEFTKSMCGEFDSFFNSIHSNPEFVGQLSKYTLVSELQNMYLGGRMEPDFVATITYLSTLKGGRTTPAHSKYRPQFCIPDEQYSTSGEQIFIGTDVVYPGETVQAEITLLCPELFHGKLEVGTNFEFKEGSRIVATGTIDRFINTLLVKTAPNMG